MIGQVESRSFYWQIYITSYIYIIVSVQPITINKVLSLTAAVGCCLQSGYNLALYRSQYSCTHSFTRVIVLCIFYRHSAHSRTLHRSLSTTPNNLQLFSRDINDISVVFSINTEQYNRENHTLSHLEVIFTSMRNHEFRGSALIESHRKFGREFLELITLISICSHKVVASHTYCFIAFYIVVKYCIKQCLQLVTMFANQEVLTLSIYNSQSELLSNTTSDET